MWLPFLFEIAHFAICLFAALVLFATFWLYGDAWQGKKRVDGFLRCLGFLILALSFVVTAVRLEISVIQVSFFDVFHLSSMQVILRSLGYFFILLGVVSEKIQKRPQNVQNAVAVPLVALAWGVVQFFPFGLSLLVAIFYTVKSVIGLEAHVKPAARAFLFFSVFEFLSLSSLLRDTGNITIFSWVAPFGVIWVAEHVFLLIATFILGKWVFGYLLKQFLPQLFMILSTLVLVIFLVTTTVFTSLLLRNIQDETLNQLGNDVRVLQYALDGKRTESVADAQMIAQNPSLLKSLEENSRLELGNLAEQFLISKKYTTLLIVDDHGQIVARGEDKENVGSFVADESIVKQALGGQSLAAFTTTDGVVAPTISLQASSPIQSGDKVIGAVVIGITIDNTFVDGIKKATGLEASLYGKNILSATTLVGPDSITRLTGITENNKSVSDEVLGAGKVFSGGTSIGNKLYFVAQAPLFDADKVPTGMILVGRDQLGVLQTASRSVEVTFIASALLLIISIFPSYVISRYISSQL